MLKFLITGVSGFAGQHLAQKLLAENHIVHGTYKTEGFQPITGINYHRCDLTYKQQIVNILTNNTFDGIFHLAAQTHIPLAFQDPLLTFNTNTIGTINLCESILSNAPQSIIMQCSTGDVYGNVKEQIKENCPLQPNNPYGVSKAAADMYILERSQNAKLKNFIVRPFSHTGPGRPSTFSISSDARQIAKIILNKQDKIIRVGNIKASRAVLDVRDMVDVYYQLMTNHLNGAINNGEVFNISATKTYDIEHYIKIMLNEFKLKDVELTIDEKLYRPIDTLTVHPNSVKVKRFLNWKPKYSLKNTLKDLVKYWINKEKNNEC